MGELSSALRSIESRHREHHWHCWHSDSGALWATSPHCPAENGSGTTVGDVGSLEHLERQIAETEHRWELLTGVAA